MASRRSGSRSRDCVSARRAVARAQVVDLDMRTNVFIEPSKTSHMSVITPSASLRRDADRFAYSVHAGYAADVVSGASEAVKAGPTFAAIRPDIVSAASVHDFRQVGTGGFVLHRGHTDLGGAYAYGTEHDYRSNAITANASTDFFERNTKLEFAYAHGFDKVCDLAINALQAVTARQALDQSKGCFTSDKTRREVPVSTDNFQGAWTQSWTPVFASQLVLTGAVQQGFLSNPYRSGRHRSVRAKTRRSTIPTIAREAPSRFDSSTSFAPSMRRSASAGARIGTRGASSARRTRLGLRTRASVPGSAFQLTGRYYRQTGAVFWSDDYTGGEPLNGPRGQYFSGDREVSPLRSLLGGARFTGSWHGHPGARVAHLFLDFEASLGATVLKTYLEDFTWAGRYPDDTLALIFSGNMSGTF